MNLVIDASAAAMWFVPEQYSVAAAVYIASDYELVAPDLLHFEVASALLKALRRGKIDEEQVTEAVTVLLPGAVQFVAAVDYVDAALQLAKRFGGSLYDAVYIAVAHRLAAPLVTNDRTQATLAGMAGVETRLLCQAA